MKTPIQIVWAVDPFVEDYKNQEAAIHAISNGAVEGVAIQPVYVWNGQGAEAYGDPGELIAKNLAERLQEQGEATLRKWAATQLPVPLNPLVILKAESTSFSDQARAVVEYAKEADSPLIIACHTPRKGVQKWFSGSFCESLSLVSEVSVLIVPESWDARAHGKTILFTTDFSLPSMAAFDRVLDFAASRRWGLTIFHNVEYPLYPAVDFVYAATDALAKVEDDLVIEAHAKADAMGLRAKARGIETRIVVDESRRNHAGLSVLHELEKGYGVVAAAAHSGPVQRTFVGSTSRFLIRESRIPVWVLRPMGVSRKKTAGPLHKRSKEKTGRESSLFS